MKPSLAFIHLNCSNTVNSNRMSILPKQDNKDKEHNFVFLPKKKTESHYIYLFTGLSQEILSPSLCHNYNPSTPALCEPRTEAIYCTNSPNQREAKGSTNYFIYLGYTYLFHETGSQ